MKVAVIGASSFSGAALCRAMNGIDFLPIRFNGRAHRDLNLHLSAMLSEIAEHRPDAVVNFAALNMVAESWAHYADYYRTNVIGIAQLAHGVAAMPWVKKFVQVSTPEVYGTTETFIKEGQQFRPSTPYAVSRAAADLHLEAMYRSTGFPVCFTRTVNVYGPGQQPYRIIPKTVLSILKGRTLMLHGGGASTRSFIHIDDVSDAILRILQSGTPGDTYHIATARQTSIRDLVREVCELMGADFDQATRTDAERLGKDMAYQLDSSKIREELGWRPRIDLEEGLKETVQWFKMHAGDYDVAALEYRHRP